MFFETLLTDFYEQSNSTNSNCSLKELTHIHGFKLYCCGDFQICVLSPKPPPGSACFSYVPSRSTKTLPLLCPELSLGICLSSSQAGAVICWSPWELADPASAYLLLSSLSGINGFCPKPCPSTPIPFSFIFILLIYLVNSTQTTLYMCTAFYIAFFLLPFFHLPVFLFISCIREPFRILSSLTSMQIKLVMHLYQEKKRYKCEQNQFIKFMKSKFIKK